MNQILSAQGGQSLLAAEGPCAQHAAFASAAHNIFRSYSGPAAPVELFRLRYDVYCTECTFLPAGAYPDGEERDEYDHVSLHIGAFDEEEQLIGSIRLVQPTEQQPYPFEAHCALFDSIGLPPRALSAEVSRLVVRKGHRRRRAAVLYGVEGELAAERRDPDPSAQALGRRSHERDSPLLLLGMYREMYRHSVLSGVRYWYAAMERALARSLQRMGFTFQAIGPQSDYYGEVTPYLLDLRQLEVRLAAVNPVLGAWFGAPLRPATIAA